MDCCMWCIGRMGMEGIFVGKMENSYSFIKNIYRHVLSSYFTNPNLLLFHLLSFCFVCLFLSYYFMSSLLGYSLPSVLQRLAKCHIKGWMPVKKAKNINKCKKYAWVREKVNDYSILCFISDCRRQSKQERSKNLPVE